jgi:hypothetical protein
MTPGWLTFAQQASLPTLAVSALLLAVVTAIKAWPRLRELQIEGDASLRTSLLARVSELEARVKDLEKLLGLREAKHAAESQVLRHRLANEEAALDACILLAEANPDRIIELLPKIKEMREAGRQRIALEKGAIAGAQVASQGGEG